MKKLILLICLILSSTSAFSQVDEDYSKTLKTMLQVSGSEQNFQMAIKQMIVMYKQSLKDVPTEVWDELENEFLKISLNELTYMLVPVYSKYITKDELQDIIEFYQTPSGAKFAKNSPLIMKESMLIGQEWGKKIGQNLTETLREKGY
ncbi:DUF2059 domain-containing protein [Flavobacteriaceae bacterium Ap0902]|nr:DUF2059 domain-containing protein [Flavobacteriaceae bacterium Ap0902]